MLHDSNAEPVKHPLPPAVRPQSNHSSPHVTTIQGKWNFSDQGNKSYKVATHSRSHPEKNWVDYFLTYVTTLGLIVAGVLTFRMASQNFGELGLSQYAVMRRAVAFIHPFLAIGLAVSLSRKVAARRFDSPHINQTTYLLGAIVLVCASILAVLLPLLLLPSWAAYAVFGRADYSKHAIALAPMIAGMGLHVVCYSQYRGVHSIRLANLVQVMNLAIVPLVAMTAASSVREAFINSGIAITAISLVAILFQLSTNKENIGSIKSAIVSLIRYGVPRVPGDIAFAALIMLPAAAATHSSNVDTGGLVAFGIMLLTLSQSIVSPISTIILPQATEMLRDGHVGELRTKVVRLLVASMAVTVLGVCVFFAASDFILAMLLGSYAAELPGISRVILLGAVPLNCHVCLRSIIDAGRERAINGRNAFIALTLFVFIAPVTRLFTNDLLAFSAALAIALWALAILTAWEAWKILCPTSNQRTSVAYNARQPNIKATSREVY